METSVPQARLRLFGLILGLSPRQIRARKQTIFAFADLHEVLDLPVKPYSAGMVMRLAFACAIHADPELLVVDEVIEVGDRAFQERCFAKIEELRRGGMSLVLATHNTPPVQRYCDRLLHLEPARDPPRSICSRKRRRAVAAAHDPTRDAAGPPPGHPPTPMTT